MRLCDISFREENAEATRLCPVPEMMSYLEEERSSSFARNFLEG